MRASAEVLSLFPEFATFRYRLPWVSDRQNEILVDRLARRALRLATGCIVWDGNCNNDGYARLTLWHAALGEKQNHFVHRIAWFLKTGREVPTFREIAHKCNTPPCFNPLHLVLQRMVQNRRDSAYNTLRKRGIIAEASA